jgi:long-chain acyl-CoA synthetase
MNEHLYEIVRRRADRHPTAVALGGQHGLSWKTLSGRQLQAAVDAVAAELGQAGVREGDRVVLWVPNTWRTPVYLFALWKLGAIAVPFDRDTNVEAAERILDSVEPRLALIGYDERPAWSRRPNAVEWWEPGARGGRPDDGWSPPREELAALVFTSGTTGNPKGCMITHANLCSQVEAAYERIPLDGTCRLASILPLSHLFELTCGLLYPLDAGAAIHYIPSRRPPDIVRVLSEQRVTHMMAVPQLLGLMGHALDKQLRDALPARAYAALGATADKLPLGLRRPLFWMVHRKLGGRLRLMAVGGAALPADTQRLWERLGVRVVQGYGTSECSPMIACGRPDGSTPIGSVGTPIRGVQVRLSPEGELLVRGPNVMRGYWNDAARTAEVLRDGWYATGDLASIDAAGNIYLAGRARDLIVLPSGLKVWPSDVEDALRADPAVRDAAVIAVPTPGGGAKLHAYLLPAERPTTDPAAVVASVNGRLAQHQRLSSASWWPEPDFPRTSTLKVRRHLLPPPSGAQAVMVDVTRASDDPVGQTIAAAAHVATVTPTQTLDQLGLDSLGLVELALALETRTEKAIAEGELRPDMTVDQVRALVPRAPALEEGGQAAAARVADVPEWPYTWGRVFRALALPVDLLYRFGVTETVVLGGEHLAHLPPRVILAGTHHGFADMPLVRHALGRTPARGLARRLVVATAGGGVGWHSLTARYAVLAFGLHPLEQERAQDVSLRKLVRLARAGNAILIFPQGTHARVAQERAEDPAVRFRAGVAHLAAALEAVVVPFGVAGTEVVMPAFVDGFRGPVVAGVPLRITRTKLAIVFGAPLRLEPGEEPHAFAARLQQAAYALTRRAEQARARALGGSAA